VTETTVRSVPAYRPPPSVEKVRRTEFWAVMEIVSDAARELDTAGTYLTLLGGLGGPAEQ
jgi:hypothetical protein